MPLSPRRLKGTNPAMLPATSEQCSPQQPPHPSRTLDPQAPGRLWLKLVPPPPPPRPLLPMNTYWDLET